MNLWKKMSLTAKYMLLSLVILFFGFGLLGFIITTYVYPFEAFSKYILGLLLGCVVTAVRLIIMDRSIDKTVDMPEKKAKVHYQLMFFVRYGLLILFAVVVVVFNNVFGVWGGVIGILCMQLSAYGANYLLTKHEKKIGKIPATKVQKAESAKNHLEVEEFEEIPVLSSKAFDVMNAPIEERKKKNSKDE